MRNPENNDNLSAYSAADRAIMQAAKNASRLATKKAPVKKAAVAKKAVAKKAAPAPKPTDSRFTGMGAGKPKSTSRAGSMSYTPGSAKNNKATYTTGSGVRYASSTPKKAAPAQKTKDLKKNPLVKFVTSRVGGKSGGTGKSK